MFQCKSQNGEGSTKTSSMEASTERMFLFMSSLHCLHPSVGKNDGSRSRSGNSEPIKVPSHISTQSRISSYKKN